MNVVVLFAACAPASPRREARRPTGETPDAAAEPSDTRVRPLAPETGAGSAMDLATALPPDLRAPEPALPDAGSAPAVDMASATPTDGGEADARDAATEVPPSMLPKNALYATDFETDPGDVFPKDAHWMLCERAGESRAMCVDAGDSPIFLTNGAAWKDYVAEVSVNIPRGGGSLFVRAKDARNHYSLELKFDGANKLFTLWRMVDGRQSGLRSAKVDFPFNTYVRLRVQAKGTAISFAMKTDPKAAAWQELGMVTDASNATGGVGLKTHATGGRFDDLVVLPIE